MAKKSLSNEDIAELSDEEFLRLGESNFTLEEEEEEVSEEEPAEIAETPDAEESEDESELEDDENQEEDPDEDEPEDEAEDEGESNEQIETKARADEPAKNAFAESDNADTAKSDSTNSADAIDYESIYNQIFAPFKAVGKEITVQSVDEVIGLMKQGVDYTKKMVGIKESAKVIKTLSDNGIDESTLNFLIDLKNRDPQAINKLIQDSGIDPLELDEDDVKNYRAKNHAPTDASIELDQVLDSIRNSPNYDRTLKVVADDWDVASQKIIGSTPQIIAYMEAQITQGHYAIIESEMQRQRNVGGLQGLNDLQAYQQVGNELNAKGSFDQINQAQVNRQQSRTATRTIQPKHEKLEDASLKERRKKAGASSGSSRTKQKTGMGAKDLSKMSDEEFSKQFSQSLQM